MASLFCRKQGCQIIRFFATFSISNLRVIGPRPLRCPKAVGCAPAHFPAIFRPRQFSRLPSSATGGGRHENPTSHARRAHNRDAIVQIFLVNEELGNRKCDFRVLWLVAPKKISVVFHKIQYPVCPTIIFIKRI